MAYIKVKDHSDLVRDTSSNAIINTNNELYNAAKARRVKSKRDREEINSIKRDISEIKGLLNQLINSKIQ